MIKRWIKLGISMGLWLFDRLVAMLCRLRGQKPPGRAVILYYHGIRQEEADLFARQMDVVKQYAQPIPAEWQGSLDPGRHYAAITFDDGFLSVAENAWPALRSRQIPATIFVPTGYLGKVPGWLTNPKSKAGKEQVMTPEQLRAIASNTLITIGSHTVLHRRMDRLNETDARMDLFESKAHLETVLGRPVDTFSFPHGAFTDGVLQLAKQAGYKVVFGISPTCAVRRLEGFLLGRVAVEPDDWHWEFKLKLAGAYRWMAR